MPKARGVVVLLWAAVLLSCVGETYNVAEMVDPKVTEVFDGGRQAKVNIGMFDQVHAGQRLYVVRNNRPVGLLTVRDPKEYSSDCVVIAPNDVTEMPTGGGDIKVGDLVARDFRGVTATGTLREKVPRLVPVPYEVPDEVVAAADKALGGPEKRQEIWKKIPRDQVEAWRRAHPYVGRVHP